jgi:hypothetical protein
MTSTVSAPVMNVYRPRLRTTKLLIFSASGAPRDFLHLPRDSLYLPRDSFGFPYNSGNPKSSTCPPYALRRAAVGGNSSAAALSRCLSAAFSASSRLLDLKGEVPSSAPSWPTISDSVIKSNGRDFRYAQV